MPVSRGQHFSESYKRQAVTKAKASSNISQTIREMGITSKSLHNWIKKYSGKHE